MTHAPGKNCLTDSCPHPKRVVRVRRYSNCSYVAKIDVMCAYGCGYTGVLERMWVCGVVFDRTVENIVDQSLILDATAEELAVFDGIAERQAGGA